MSNDKKKPEKLDAKAHENEREDHKKAHLERVAAVEKLALIKIPKFEPAKPDPMKPVDVFKSPAKLRTMRNFIVQKPPKEEA